MRSTANAVRSPIPDAFRSGAFHASGRSAPSRYADILPAAACPRATEASSFSMPAPTPCLLASETALFSASPARKKAATSFIARESPRSDPAGMPSRMAMAFAAGAFLKASRVRLGTPACSRVADRRVCEASMADIALRTCPSEGLSDGPLSRSLDWPTVKPPSIAASKAHAPMICGPLRTCKRRHADTRLTVRQVGCHAVPD